ncbi:aminotransferase class V-fold PLP-dependent enzyme [Rheinheimera sp. WS51]|uniref:aminotransferase class V-fold PLP-dependent enzyme n=1 Tax=Rheinheimera sp. WS51 TaxID=3425886 RepID=UPI003D8D54D9
MYKQFYQGFLTANKGKQHFACHSHHYWPDVTRDAMLEYWDDSARLVDDKWRYIFSEKVPETQQLIADILQLPHPEQIVFAPNTHELVMRLISCFDLRKPLRILSTDSEFHSFSRQVKRLAEYDNVQLDSLATEPFSTFEQRFIQAASNQDYDIIFVSQVFFNSGYAISDLTQFVQQLAEQSKAMIVIDGYHGFMALPTDLSTVSERIFYVAGSYKYAQAGEGCCFMAVPLGSEHRPLYTGWFAEFGTLAAEKTATTLYSEDGFRFAGSTMDFTALYRLNAVLRLFKQQGITVGRSHQYVQKLQQVFLDKLEIVQHAKLNSSSLLMHDLNHHGHFLTFKLANASEAAELASQLKRAGIETDYRGERLRFGFGLYHDSADYDLSCLKETS